MNLAIIKGYAKTAGKFVGKYTLKGLGKGVELTARGATQAVDALVTSPQMQKIATGAGMLAATVMIPSVGVPMISALGLKYVTDNYLLGKNKDALDEINDAINMGNVITRVVSNKILSPLLNKTDRGIKSLGNKYQRKVDQMMR